MKKFKILASVAVLLLLSSLSSCKGDLLDLAPYDSVSSGNMWTTENLCDKGVMGVYNILRGTYGGNYPFTFEQFSASCSARSPHALLTGTCTTGNGTFTDAWRAMYEGVSRSNDAVHYLAESTAINDAKKGRLIAECKFLRAYCYYILNVLYAGVPLYLEPTPVNDFTKGRNTRDEVWEAILADLSDCIAESNLPNSYPAGDASYGRVTKGAAYALRAKVYLWKKDWAKAEADFRAVGPCGYKLYGGEYKDMFVEANEQSGENVFAVSNMALANYGHELTFRYGSRSTYGSCWNNYFPGADFVDTYTYADGKPFNWDELLPGYSSMSPVARSVYFLRDNMTDAEISKMQSNGADMSKYLPNGNEARIRQAYDTRDPRLLQSVITPYSTYLGANGATDNLVTLRWPYRVEYSEPFDLRTDTNSYFYYLYRKFVAEGASAIPNRQQNPCDIPVIRYTDCVLGLAEALNEQNKTAEAITLVNQVRARAGVAALNSNSYTQVNGQADMRNRIRQERRWEFIGEGVTYFDELRWGTWKEAMFNMSATPGLKQIWGQVTQGFSYQGDYSTLWAIPVTECEMNSNLEQNPGWIN